MSSDIVTSSRSDKRRTRSATKAILDFEGNLWLKLPKLGRKAMLGMMEGREIARLDTAMVQWEGRHALHEAYEKTEVFGTEFTYRLPEWRDSNENPEKLCAGREWMQDRGIVSREHTLRLSWYDGRVIANKNDHLRVLIERKRRAMATMIITKCLKSYDINAYDQYGYTPLHHTVMCEEPELCRLLCERGDIDVDKGHKNSGDTAFHLAAYHGRMEYMRILLDVGKANVNANNNLSNTPLHYAALAGRIEAATLLIERGAEINPIDDDYERGTPCLQYHYCHTKGALWGATPQGKTEEEQMPTPPHPGRLSQATKSFSDLREG